MLAHKQRPLVEAVITGVGYRTSVNDQATPLDFVISTRPPVVA